MSTTTTRLGLYKPAADGSELVNVVTDLNNNLDSIDAKMGAFVCTSGTRPGSPYNGQFIRETDTGKLMLWDGTAWRQVLYNTAAWTNPLSVSGGDVTATAGAFLVARSAGIAFDAKVTADSVSRWSMDTSGLMEWGSGAAARDVNLYRASANVLKTDDALQVVQTLTVSGATALGDTTISGNLNIGSARYRTQLSTVTTVANTAAEATLASMTLPAADPVAGTVYRIRAWGTAAVTGTPTLTFRFRLAATTVLLVAFPAITARSGMADGQWAIDAYVSVPSIGVSGTWAPMMQMQHNFLTSATTWTPLGPVTATPVTQDTTTVNAPQLTVQWSAASASNTITCRGFTAERVA
jgi:hypothetical protein